MKATFLAGAAALALVPGAALALGLDRSGQPVDILFEDGNAFELSFGRVMPDVTGTDAALFGGSASGEVAENYNQVGAAIKYQLTDRLSFALIADQPFGSDVSYPAGGSFALGGTQARVDSKSLTALARYEISDAFSVHGGLRRTRLSADVTLAGLAYGGLSGYNAGFEEDSDTGYVLGVAYERPDIALRVALTYSSKMEHDLKTTETLNGIPVNLINPLLSASSTTTVETPASVNLDFQTGLNQQTLLFGQIRYAWYGDVIVSPVFFDIAQDGGLRDNDSLTDIEDGYALTVGIGRRLTDKLSGSVTFGYEQDRDNLVSPLSPTNGQKSIGLGLSYQVTDEVNIAGGARYIWLGDASPATGDPRTARADFADNDVVGVGLQIGYRF